MRVVHSSPALRGVHASPWTDCLAGSLPLKAVSPSRVATHSDLAVRVSVLGRRTTSKLDSNAGKRTMGGRNHGILGALKPGRES